MPVRKKKPTTFGKWYERISKKYGLNSNPDSPKHHYNYRKFYYDGGRSPDSSGHFPSKYKTKDHPNRVINGVDTITNKPVNERKKGRFRGRRKLKKVKII